MKKAPDRINITRKAKAIVDTIDSEEYFKLGSKSTTRSELFVFAAALGIDTMMPTELKNIHGGGLILESSIDSKTKALIYACFIGGLDNTDMLDDITNKSDVYNNIQEYANTGFEILEDYIQNKKDVDLIWDLLTELDAYYNENVVGN